MTHEDHDDDPQPGYIAYEDFCVGFDPLDEIWDDHALAGTFEELAETAPADEANPTASTARYLAAAVLLCAAAGAVSWRLRRRNRRASSCQ